MRSTRGFEELPHTADLAIRVWAEDLPALFIEAANGFNALCGCEPVGPPTVHRTFEQRAADAEGLLVAFLSELVYLQEQDQLVFAEFAVRLVAEQLFVNMKGAPFMRLVRPIKAVTYHNIRIARKESGFEVEIVFDV